MSNSVRTADNGSGGGGGGGEAGAQLMRETNVTLNPPFGTSSVNNWVDKRKPFPPLPLLLCLWLHGKTPNKKYFSCWFWFFFWSVERPEKPQRRGATLTSASQTANQTARRATFFVSILIGEVTLCLRDQITTSVIIHHLKRPLVAGCGNESFPPGAFVSSWKSNTSRCPAIKRIRNNELWSGTNNLIIICF